MAAALGISPFSVRPHLNRIYSKLGVRNRTQAALWALCRGLVDLEEAIECEDGDGDDE
jgi:DNA-binding CsgD family transcriptional regulator